MTSYTDCMDTQTKPVSKSETALTRVSRELHHQLVGMMLADPDATSASLLDELALAEAKRRYDALPSHVRQTVEARAKKSREAKAAKQSA